MGFFACSKLSTIYIENILCGLIGLDLFILTVKTNDMMLVIYLSSLIRSVIALHNLINNKMLNKEHERIADAVTTSLSAITV
jgi:26S proteasome regulatory subunit N8